MKKTTEQRIREHHAVLSVDDERAIGDGIWVNLRAGFVNPYGETHFIHEDTWLECIAQLTAIEPCNCIECAPEKV